MSASKRICLGAFAGAHGVRGETRVKTFTDAPENIDDYGPVETEDGARRFTLSIVRTVGPDMAIARAPEIASREDAESLKGQRIYIDRERLPATDEDEFYLDDLVGLNAVDESDAPMGVIAAVYNFGAGDVIELKEIPGVKGARLIGFTKVNVPHVRLDAGEIVVNGEALLEHDEVDDPRAEKSFIEAAMRNEDA